jgi:asparagine synthase (glutamine-hydrolysing)
MHVTSFLKTQAHQFEFFIQSKHPKCAKHQAVVHSVLADHRTYLSSGALFDLARLVQDLELKHLNGAIIEAGCALGGSAVVIASAKSPQRPFYVYDTFGMIPPPSDRNDDDVQKRYEVIVSGKSKGIGNDTYYGYRENLYDDVRQSFSTYGHPVEINSVHLIKGLFQETMTDIGPVAMAHIDCDWYESVFTCLEHIVPRLVTGGTLVFDDYDRWSGCRKAVDEFFADRRGDFTFTRRHRLHVTKR